MDRKEYLRQYRQSEEYKAKNRERMKTANQTDAVKDSIKKYNKSLKRRFNNAKRFNTKHRKTMDGLPDLKEWTITFEEYIRVLSRNCYYCNVCLETESGSGLDRIQNTQGYVTGNVNPCCGECNRIRSDSMDAEEFKRQTILNGRWQENIIPSVKKE